MKALSVRHTSEFCMSACYIKREVTEGHIWGKQRVVTGHVLSAGSLWDIAIKQLRNRLETLEQGLDSLWMGVASRKWVKLLRNSANERAKEGNTGTSGGRLGPLKV